ncbi:MAG: hypothetical protein Q4D50_12200 [Eubacteriales bacterium]|nr:hypothetical protein [Eubacteriales bacterium]
MKKNVLYVFSLLLYILVVCTLVSQKIETEMTTLAEVREVDFTKLAGQSLQFSWTVLFDDGHEGEGDGDVMWNLYLYEVIDGTGWESGLRLQEVPRSYWTLTLPDGIIRMPVDRDYRLVKSASRRPRSGEPVEILEIKKGNDRYLAIYDNGVQEEHLLPYQAEIAAQNSNALLLNMTNVSTPFLEHRAKSMSIPTDLATRIFSLTDVAQFLENIPLVVLLAVVLAAPVFIWLYSFVLVRNTSQNKVFLLTNVGIMAGLLCFAVWIMNRIDLPASMLPVSNIFEFDYYSGEMTMIFDALHELGDVAPDITGMVDGIRESALAYATKGVLLTFAVILAEALIVWCRRHIHAKKSND